MGTNDRQLLISQRRIPLRLTMALGDRVVNASDGAILAGFTADVEFDVVDDANAVAAEVAGSGYGSGRLDEATILSSVAVM